MSLWRKIPNGKYKEYDEIIKKNIKKYRHTVLKNDKVNRKQKALFLLSYLGKPCYKFIISTIKKWKEKSYKINMKANTLIKFRKNKLLNKIIHTLLLKKGLEIPSSVIIGENCDFPHNSVGTVIHPDTIIKDNVKIYQNVTIGRADIYEDYKSSKMKKIIIEEGAIICAGAKILSKQEELVIGKYSIIWANAVLLNSKGENDIWAGVPEKKVGMRK